MKNEEQEDKDSDDSPASEVRRYEKEVANPKRPCLANVYQERRKTHAATWTMCVGPWKYRPYNPATNTANFPWYCLACESPPGVVAPAFCQHSACYKWSSIRVPGTSYCMQHIPGDPVIFPAHMKLKTGVRCDMEHVDIEPAAACRNYVASGRSRCEEHSKTKAAAEPVVTAPPQPPAKPPSVEGVGEKKKKKKKQQTRGRDRSQKALPAFSSSSSSSSSSGNKPDAPPATEEGGSDIAFKPSISRPLFNELNRLCSAWEQNEDFILQRADKRALETRLKELKLKRCCNCLWQPDAAFDEAEEGETGLDLGDFTCKECTGLEGDILKYRARGDLARKAYSRDDAATTATVKTDGEDDEKTRHQPNNKAELLAQLNTICRDALAAAERGDNEETQRLIALSVKMQNDNNITIEMCRPCGNKIVLGDHFIDGRCRVKLESEQRNDEAEDQKAKPPNEREEEASEAAAPRPHVFATLKGVVCVACKSRAAKYLGALCRVCGVAGKCVEVLDDGKTCDKPARTKGKSDKRCDDHTRANKCTFTGCNTKAKHAKGQPKLCNKHGGGYRCKVVLSRESGIETVCNQAVRSPPYTDLRCDRHRGQCIAQ